MHGVGGMRVPTFFPLIAQICLSIVLKNWGQVRNHLLSTPGQPWSGRSSGIQSTVMPSIAKLDLASGSFPLTHSVSKFMMSTEFLSSIFSNVAGEQYITLSTTCLTNFCSALANLDPLWDNRSEQSCALLTLVVCRVSLRLQKHTIIIFNFEPLVSPR